MAQTKLNSQINPEVMADMISAELPSKIKFSPLAEIDTTLVGQAGDTVTVPKFQYIGDADDLSEGVAMGTVTLQTSSSQVTIKEAGKAVEITDKAINSGYGDPVGEANRQLELAIANKVDNDLVVALQGATLLQDEIANGKISYNAIVNAVDLFEEEDDEAKILFIHPLQKGTLRKDPEFTKNVPEAFMTGVIGEIAGCQVVASNKVPKLDTAADTDTTKDNAYENFVVKAGALAVYLKEETEIEADRDILARTNVIAAHKHYAASLKDDSKVVRLRVAQ